MNLGVLRLFQNHDVNNCSPPGEDVVSAYAVIYHGQNQSSDFDLLVLKGGGEILGRLVGDFEQTCREESFVSPQEPS
jgi:hypothetical protein